MNKKNLSGLVLLLLATFTGLATAQQPGQKAGGDSTHILVNIETIDGSKILGELLGVDSASVHLRSKMTGDISIPKVNIKKMQTVAPQTIKPDGAYWFDNPNATRNFFAPTGFGLRKGEGYYQNIWVFLNSVSYGFTDYFTVGAGFEAITFLINSGLPVFYLTPKFSFKVSEKFHAGAGLLYLGIPDLFSGNNSYTSAGIAYGVGTYGDRNTNLTFGMGYGYSNDGWGKRPVINLSGQIRIGKNVGLVSENYLIPNDNTYTPLMSLGARIMWERVTMDVALVRPLNTDFNEGFIGLPYLDVVIPFGKF